MRKFTAILCLLCVILFSVPGLSEEIVLSFLGDCSIGEMVQASGLKGSYTQTVDEKGFDWPFSLVYGVLSSDDFTFANNEVCFTTKNKHADKLYVLRAAPKYAQVYLYSGIDAVNTANNHSFDFFTEGYHDTLKALTDYNINNFGTFYPNSSNQIETIGVYEVKGIRIGAIGLCYPFSDSPSSAIVNRIQSLKSEEACDLVVVSLHWGVEEQTTPSAYQIKLAKAMIDAGADIIWGHHPHILQQVMFYQGKPIMFSTGNFTFGSISDLDPDTGIFQCTYKRNDTGVELSEFSVIPCRTQGKGDFRPYLLTDEDEKRNMLKKLIYARTVNGIVNLPEYFQNTGTVAFIDGELVSLEESGMFTVDTD